MANTKQKFKKNVIYKMKQSYGVPVSIQQIDQHSVDPQTGEKTTVLDVFNVKKAIVLRAREFRSFVYDLAYISANKDFTTGGFFDPTDVGVVIDTKDLKYTPTEDDFVIIKNRRYNVLEMRHLDEIILITARIIRGALDVNVVSRHDGLVLSETITYEVVDKLTRTVSDTLDFSDSVIEVP